MMPQQTGERRGLNAQEAAARLLTHGHNIVGEGKRTGALSILIRTAREPMFLLLLAAASLYLLVGGLGEGLFLLGGALVSIGLVIFQDVRSENALAALREFAEPFCRVIRDGEQMRTPSRMLVPGDLLLVTEGERISADARLLSGDVLSVDESMLTGESAPVLKSPADGADLFAGTMVTGGHGLAEVIQTGPRTRLGALGKSLVEIHDDPTPLQRATAQAIKPLAAGAILFCLMIAAAYGVLRGDWIGGAVAGLTVAISLMPEEFPMVLAVFLALGSWRLARHNVLVRRAAVIETLGATTMLCVDKTGTLTQNRMRVDAVLPKEMDYPLRPDAIEGRGVLETAFLASSVHPIDAMDRAVHAALAARVAQLLSHFGALPVLTSPLRPDRLAVVQYWRPASGAVFAAAKGAPEAIFVLCGLAAEDHERAAAAVTAMAESGMRVLAVAAAEAESTAVADQSFKYQGLLGFFDPLRADAPAALALARRAGIDVAMVTGDYSATAQAIARQVGIDDASTMTGAEIAKLSPEALRERVRRTRIFARVLPEQKLALVAAFQACGHVVAMTGDGVNDAPALKKADVGIAMGVRGSDVAREAAELILLDDSFVSIMGGVRLGRRIFANLRKALIYIVSIHIPIAGVALIPILIGAPQLLFPMHVVLLELIIDPVCALVFEAERSDKQTMERPPRKIKEPLFGMQEFVRAAVQGAVLLGGVLGIYFWGLSHGVAEAESRALGFVALVLGNLTLALVDSVDAGGRLLDARRWMFWAIAGAASLILLVSLSVPTVSEVFYLARPAPHLLALAVTTAVVCGGWFRAASALRRPHWLFQPTRLPF